jgi:hypothetical protein
LDFSLWIVPLACAVAPAHPASAPPIVATFAQAVRGVPLSRSSIDPERPDSDPPEWSVTANVRVREEPDEEDEDEEEDEGDGKEKEDDDDDDTDNGYSE